MPKKSKTNLKINIYSLKLINEVTDERVVSEKIQDFVSLTLYHLIPVYAKNYQFFSI